MVEQLSYVASSLIILFFKGLDYEGIYRKTGGSSQSKAITQLFERGQYESFDLLDTDVFNDISSVTSVLKNYFRALPNPLLTFDLHEQFVHATGVYDVLYYVPLPNSLINSCGARSQVSGTLEIS